MYLLDTNILLELLLKRHKCKEVEAFLRQIPQESLKISDFLSIQWALFLLEERCTAYFLK